MKKLLTLLFAGLLVFDFFIIADWMKEGQERKVQSYLENQEEVDQMVLELSKAQ